MEKPLWQWSRDLIMNLNKLGMGKRTDEEYIEPGFLIINIRISQETRGIRKSFGGV